MQSMKYRHHMPSPNEKFVVTGLQISWYAFSREETICISLCSPVHCNTIREGYQICYLVVSQLCSWERGGNRPVVLSGGVGRMAACYHVCNTTTWAKLADLVREGVAGTPGECWLQPWAFPVDTCLVLFLERLHSDLSCLTKCRAFGTGSIVQRWLTSSERLLWFQSLLLLPIAFIEWNFCARSWQYHDR